MSCPSITLAAQHAQSLMRQGKSKRSALDHATQRFGVTKGAILQEIRSWHEFKLPVDEPEGPEDADGYTWTEWLAQRLHAEAA